MFKCNDCGHEFVEPYQLKERDMIETDAGIRWLTVYIGECCPKCGREGFEETRDESNHVAEPNKIVGVGLQQAAATANDR